MKTLAEVLELYPQVKKAYYESPFQYRAWLPLNMSPTFVIQAFHDAKQYSEFEKFYRSAINMGKLSEETAYLRCGIEKILCKSSLFYQKDYGNKFKDGVGYEHSKSDYETVAKVNKSAIKTEDLLKHFTVKSILRMVESGSLTDVLTDMYGKEFVNLMLSISGVAQNQDAYFKKMYDLGGNLYKAYKSLKQEEQDYLYKNYTVEQLNKWFVEGVHAYILGKFTSAQVTNFDNVNSAQLAWGVYEATNNWCGKGRLVL